MNILPNIEYLTKMYLKTWKINLVYQKTYVFWWWTFPTLRTEPLFFYWGQYADRPSFLVDKIDFSSFYTNPRWMRVYTLQNVPNLYCKCLFTYLVVAIQCKTIVSGTYNSLALIKFWYLFMQNHRKCKSLFSFSISIFFNFKLKKKRYKAIKKIKP